MEIRTSWIITSLFQMLPLFVCDKYNTQSIEVSYFNNSAMRIQLWELNSYGASNFIQFIYSTLFNFILYLTCHRSSHQMYSIRKSVLMNFAKLTGKDKCQSPFLNKVAGLRPASLLKKRLWHRRFPVNFAKFLRTSFLQNTYGRLPL